ncbi:LamB/YcsF family protein [Enterobacteriaceae bacterium C34A]
MSVAPCIDLNCDLGESYGQWTLGDDAAILPFISSANVACGFHAGSPVGILDTLRAAQRLGVVVGAHVSYPDLVGFGRRNMDVASDELTADVIYQIGALQGLAAAAGTRVTYVKPHGALYNTIAHDKRQAMAVIAALQALDKSLSLVALAGSALITWAQEAGIHTVAEAFADRAYHHDGTLVSRREAGAVIHDPEAVAQRVVQMITDGGVLSVEGSFTAIDAQSVCVHGDSPDAVNMTRQIRQRLEAEGVLVRAFGWRA